MFKALKVDHIGIAVKDLEQAKKFYTEVLGLQAMGEEVRQYYQIEADGSFSTDVLVLWAER